MQIYYFLYLCLGQTIIQVMEIDNQSVDYRPLILVAEDDDSNFKLIKAIIGRKCEIMWAKNGEEIVSLFREYRDKADAILMDIKMPVMVWKLRKLYAGKAEHCLLSCKRPMLSLPTVKMP